MVSHLIRTYGITGVINFAAESHVDRSILGPQVFAETNVVGTCVLLKEALDAGVKSLAGSTSPGVRSELFNLLGIYESPSVNPERAMDLLEKSLEAARNETTEDL